MKKSLISVSAIAALTLTSIAPAFAYPAGQAPTLGLSSVSRLLPGDVVQVVISRVKKSCSVTIEWAGEDIAPVTATIRSTGKSPVMQITAPSVAGTYTLTTNTISSTCSGGSAVSLSKSLTIGKLVSMTAKLATTSGYVSKNPTVSISGTVKSGSVSVGSKTVSVSLLRNGTQVKTTTATTNASGVFNVDFAGTSYTAGTFTAEVSIAADSTYAAKSVTTSPLKLR